MMFTGIASARFVGGLLTALVLAVFTIQPVAQTATGFQAQSQPRTGCSEARETTLSGNNGFMVQTPVNGARHSGNSWVEVNGGVQ